MSSNQTPIVHVLSTDSESDENEPLQTTYFCQAEGKKTLDVVVELQGKVQDKVSFIPQRFVLVIDVSGSMGCCRDDSEKCLLDRMKIFAERFIESTTEINWLAIVTFSNNAYVLLHMTQMDQRGKSLALTKLSHLNADGGTNISEGIFYGLGVAATFNQGYGTHDCIILFTDGEANDGITDPVALVTEYSIRMQEHKSKGRINNVQLAAITVDGYEPVLLAQIRRQLSSDAFYVLNFDCDFEADMLIPLFLRQTSCISDITVDINCLERVTFEPSKTELQPGLRAVNGVVGRQYFFYALPDSVVKHIFLSLDISRASNGSLILQVNKTYLDPDLNRHNGEEFLQLDLTPMKKVREEANISAGLTGEGFVILERFSAYVVIRNEIVVTWKGAQEAFANVLKQKGRQCMYQAVEQSSVWRREENIDAARRHLIESAKEIRGLQKHAAMVLGEESMCSRMLHKHLDDYAKNLEYAASHLNDMSWARLQAMLSSLEMEMPTATGVFEPERAQPFMPPKIEEKLVETSKIVNKEIGGGRENEYRNRLLKRDEARKQLESAIKVRNLHEITKSLNICMLHGIDESTIYRAEKIKEIVWEEDQLIKKIIEFLKNKDVDNLNQAIQRFKAPGSEYVDKTGDVEKAHKYVQKVLEERRLMKLKAEIFRNLDAAIEKSDDKAMIPLIQDLEQKPLRNIVNEGEIIDFRNEMNRIRIENSLQKKVEDLMCGINDLIIAEELSKLGRKLDDLRHTMNDDFYKKNDEATAFLEKASDTFNTLVAKHRLMDDIKKAWKEFDLPFVPDSLGSLKESLLRVKELRENSSKFDGAFGVQDEERLAKSIQDIQDLENKVEQRDQLHEDMEAALEKRSYDDLKSVLKRTKKVPFLDERLIVECEKLKAFLSPKERKAALTDACKRRDISAIEKAIQDFKEANVKKYPDDLARAEKRLKKLKHIEKLNKILRKALVEREIDRLQEAIKICEEDHTHNSDIPLFSKAQDLLEELILEKLQENLKAAVQNRNLEELYEALKEIDDSLYREQLDEEYEEAKLLYVQLLELYKLKEKILQMDDSLISEIRNYKHPPVVIKTVMGAVFTLLGEPPGVANNWTTLQSLMRQTAAKPIKKRIKHCLPQHIDPLLRSKIEEYLVGLDMDNVDTKSKGASIFFAWILCMLSESKFFHPESSE